MPPSLNNIPLRLLISIIVQPVSMDLCEPRSPLAGLSTLHSSSPTVLQRAVTLLPLVSGSLCLLPACIVDALYTAVWSSQHSPRRDRGQRVLWGRLTSCCCNSADTPAGRQTDRQTEEQAGYIYSLPAYASSQPASRPHTPRRQTHPEHVVFITVWHPHVWFSTSIDVRKNWALTVCDLFK